MADSLDEIRIRLGDKCLKEMLTPKTVGPVVVLTPQETELKTWLADDSVRGKFAKWWPRKIASAKDSSQIEVDLIWDALASLCDRVFPGTCNTFNMFDPRPHVTDEQLYPYLESDHGLSTDEIDNLTLVELLQLLQGDVEKLATSAGPDARHSDDFRSVYWYGADYTFSANQAACVKQLWEAWENGTPSVGGKTLLEAAEISQDRVDVVFREHAAWKTMISPAATRGAYCLQPPSEAAIRKSARRKKSSRAAKKHA